MSKQKLKGKLNIFEGIDIQSAIESIQLIPHRPSTALNDSNTIEFSIKSGPDEYVSTENIFLHMKAKLVNKDGTDFSDTLGVANNYAPINYILNTAFDQLSIYLGSTLVSQSSRNYHYLSYIEALTSPTNKYLTTFINGFPQPSGFVSVYSEDNYGDIDKPDPALIKLCSPKSKIFTVYGRLHGGIFTSEKPLLNGVTIRFVFSKPPALVSIIGKQGIWTNDTFPQIKILDMCLYVEKVKFSPQLLNAHEKQLQTQRAVYPIKRPIIKVLNLPSGQTSFALDNVITGQLPYKIIMGLVSNKAYVGENNLDSLCFKNYNLNYLALNINGELFPKIPYQPDYANQNYQRVYFDFMRNIGALNSDFATQVDYVNYKSSLCLYAFNLNTSFAHNRDYIDITREGFINIEIKFKENLSEALKLIVYAIFDNTIQIDEHSNISIDY